LKGKGEAERDPEEPPGEPSPLELGSAKSHFKIGEVAEIVGVAPHVLRYWETEFKVLRPQKSRSQQRLYRRQDVATLLKIKHLLYEQKFTIAGARQQLKDAPDSCPTARPSGVYLARRSLERVRELVAEARAVTHGGSADPQSADPAGFMAGVGGARALLDRERSKATPRKNRPSEA